MQTKLGLAAVLLSLLSSVAGMGAVFHAPRQDQLSNGPARHYARDPDCLLCKQVVKIVVSEIHNNRTEESVINALEKVCPLFSVSGARSRCNVFVEQYTDELIHILLEEGDPSLACALLGVCYTPRTSVRRITLEKTS